ncbi:MAG: hypothetical protein VX777_00850 [Chlamydiota bacterium]|nr:hypothetical protein [Chlamydiota bacterium]
MLDYIESGIQRIQKQKKSLELNGEDARWCEKFLEEYHWAKGEIEKFWQYTL